MKKLLPALLAIFFLVACAQSSVETNEKTASENQIEDNFERNLECQKFRDEIVEEYRGVDGVFFSPKVNSCVFLMERRMDYGEEGFIDECEISDVFTKKAYDSQTGYFNCKNLLEEYQN
ncbi:MAG: hypothetical protein ABIE14_02840 [Patescibacteria group bacterium]